MLRSVLGIQEALEMLANAIPPLEYLIDYCQAPYQELEILK